MSLYNLFIVLVIFVGQVALAARGGETLKIGQEITLQSGKTFQIKELVGRGGMGTVYRAEIIADENGHTPKKPNKEVAIKVILASDSNFGMIHQLRERYDFVINEMGDPPELVKIFDVGFQQTSFYNKSNSLIIQMELIKGKSLDRSEKDFSFPLAQGDPEQLDRIKNLNEFLEFGLKIVRMLSQMNVTHSDLSPKNIIYDKTDYKLIDLDSLHLPHLTDLSYDPEYSSPEVIHGAPIPGASDLFSLGLIVARFLLGESLVKSYFDKVKEELEPLVQFDYSDETVPMKIDQMSKNPESFYLMRGYLREQLKKQRNKINNNQILESYDELTDFVLSVFNYQPMNRVFTWKNQTYGVDGQALDNFCQRVLVNGFN